MTQLRKIKDVGGRSWSVPPGDCVVIDRREPGTAQAEVIVGHGFDQRIYVKDRERAEYILTMRDPRKHCDRILDSLPSALPAEAMNEEWVACFEQGCVDRASGVSKAYGDGGEVPGYDEGWDAQQQIAIDFYDAHVIGHKP